MGLSVKTTLCIFSCFCLSVSQPVIDEVIGSMAQDASIQIRGSGFGSQGPNIVLFDDFEKGRDGQSINTGQGSAAVGGWHATSGNPRYSSESSVSGEMAFRADMSDGYRKFAEAGLPQGGETDLFISWWIYLPPQDNFPGEGTADGTNWKQLWVQGSSTVDDDLVLPVLVGNTVFLDGNDDCLGPAPTGSMHGTLERQWSFRKGEWLRLWAWVKGRADESGQVYLHELGSNGVQTLTARPSTQVQCDEGDRFEKVRINGYGRVTPNCHPMFDDVYIASGENAQARIEIGNQPVYEQCTKLSTAIPVSWSDAGIEARIQLGAFSEEELAYVFVIDKDGNVSGGVPVRRQHGLLRRNFDEKDVVGGQQFSYVVDSLQNLSSSIQILNAPSWIALENGLLTGTAPQESQIDTVVVRVMQEEQQETFTLRIRVFEPLEELVLDNRDSTTDASPGWSSSNHFSGFHGEDYLYAAAGSDEWFQWQVTDPAVFGTYEVFACWTAAEGRPVDARYEVECDSGTFVIDNIDQTVKGGQWNYLGSFCFSGSGAVKLIGGTTGDEGACADAVRLVQKAAPVKSLEPVDVMFAEKNGLTRGPLEMDLHGATLTYRLPSDGRVDVTLFDMQGRTMPVINGRMQSAGKHQINLRHTLKGMRLSNQMYVVRLKHNARVLTRRIRLK